MDKLFYCLGYFLYITVKLALIFCSDEEHFSKPMRIGFILLFPIYLIGIMCSILYFLFIEYKANIHFTKLQKRNNKFQNELFPRRWANNETRSVWDIYYLKGISQNGDTVDESVIHKTMHIFQNGVSSLEAVDIDIMLNRTSNDTTNKLKEMTDASTTRLESFVEKQLNQQVNHIMEMMHNPTEPSRVDNDAHLLEQSERNSAATVAHLQELFHQSQSAHNGQLSDMDSHLNQRFDQLQLQNKTTNIRFDQLEKKLLQVEHLEQQNMDRLQQMEQMNLDQFKQLEQKMDASEQKNMNRLEQLEQKIDALMNLLHDKYAN
jgi:hypothetical protein